MTLTVLGVEQHLVELGLVVVKGLSDLVDHLLISQVTVHEAVGHNYGSSLSSQF